LIGLTTSITIILLGPTTGKRKSKQRG